MRNQIKTVLLLGALSAFLIGLGGALGPAYLYGLTALAVVLNLGAYFYSDRIVLALNRAREVSPAEAPGLHGMVEELAVRAGMPGEVQPATAGLFIVNPFAGMGGALRSLLSTHPPMGERVRRLRAMAYGRYVRAA
jgi:Zn-dependent protease with chaperone function